MFSFFPVGNIKFIDITIKQEAFMMNARQLKKPLIVAGAASLTGAGLLAYKPYREKIVQYSKKVKNKLIPLKSRKTDLPLEKAGNPDPEDIQDNNMVSEGAQYSVEYYNKKMQ